MVVDEDILEQSREEVRTEMNNPKVLEALVSGELEVMDLEHSRVIQVRPLDQQRFILTLLINNKAYDWGFIVDTPLPNKD